MIVPSMVNSWLYYSSDTERSSGAERLNGHQRPLRGAADLAQRGGHVVVERRFPGGASSTSAAASSPLCGLYSVYGGSQALARPIRTRQTSGPLSRDCQVNWPACSASNW